MCYKDHVIGKILQKVGDDNILAPCFKENLKKILYEELDEYFVLHCSKDELYYKLHHKKRDKLPDLSQDHLYMRLRLIPFRKKLQESLDVKLI